MTTELEAAYRATTYWVFLPEGAIDLRVNGASAELASWLKTRGITQWAILTAANPGSRRLSSAENAERQAKLECMLLEKGFEPFAGENVADRGDWPIEESCFVPGISRAEAVEAAGRFEQNAVIFGADDGVPQLIWIESTINEQKNRPF